MHAQASFKKMSCIFNFYSFYSYIYSVMEKVLNLRIILRISAIYRFFNLLKCNIR